MSSGPAGRWLAARSSAAQVERAYRAPNRGPRIGPGLTPGPGPESGPGLGPWAGSRSTGLC